MTLLLAAEYSTPCTVEMRVLGREAYLPAPSCLATWSEVAWKRISKSVKLAERWSGCSRTYREACARNRRLLLTTNRTSPQGRLPDCSHLLSARLDHAHEHAAQIAVACIMQSSSTSSSSRLKRFAPPTKQAWAPVRSTKRRSPGRGRVISGLAHTSKRVAESTDSWDRARKHTFASPP